MNNNIIKGFLVFVFLLTTVSCAKKKNDINNVSTDSYIAKSDLSGTYSAVKTISAADENLDATGVIPGFHADLGFVQFVVTEKELQVRRVGEPNRTSETATIVASYPITSHFDIIREKNDFGEETNKIVEDTKKPWNERAYIRVDFGTNKIKSTSLDNIFSTEIKEEGAQVVSPLKKEGDLLSFDVDAAITQTDYIDQDSKYEIMPAGLRAKIKNTFMKVADSDFVPYEMSNKEFARFGYFRTYENFINPDKGVTVSGRKLYANRFNVCENNAKTATRLCSTNKIVYTLNKGFPDEFKQAARDVVNAWNKSFQKALDRKDDVVVLDESVEPEIGDTRYNMIAGIDEKVPTGLLGVSQTTNNPNTGETLSARASVYLGTVRLIGGNALEQFDMVINSLSQDKNVKAGKLPGSKSLELDPKSGAKLLIAKMKLNQKFLKSVIKTKGDLLKPKAQAVKSLKAIKEPLGASVARRKNALEKVLSFFDISDYSWQQASSTKFDNLKSAIQIDKNSKKEKLKELALAEKGIHSADFVEPAIELFILKFIAQHQGEPISQVREQLKTEVKRLTFYTTLIHEMGHNFGLRHNFSSSADHKNYTDQFYELEKQKQSLDPEDPKYAVLDLEQESYDFSSVMDYTGGFNETMGGTGHYDDAAIRYAYNTSIDKDGDPITGVVHNYKFCTDHEVGEDLLCQRWDKGFNVTQTTTKLIEDYNRNYYFRNFRRDRANFGDPGSYFGRVLTRTMLPIRQTADELMYRLITSGTVAASENQCDIKYLRESIDSGEMGNICDPAVLKKYADNGVQISDWSQFVYLLLKDDLSGFRKDPKTYKANGFADLLFANYHAGNFFSSVIGTPEPGLYYPMGNAANGYQLEALPAVEGSDDDKLIAFLASKGVTGDQAQQLLPKIRGNVVDLQPGVVAKSLLSRVAQDGSFKQVEVMAHLYDKLAAIIIMGARGLPVEKYEEISMNANMYFLPQSKMLSSALINSLINENNLIASATVQTRSGADVDAMLPAALNLNTKYYGLITAMTDFISDQNQEFADKMRICTDTEKGCQNTLGLGQVSFRGANGQDEFRAVQVPSGDSVAFALVSKGADISKARDQALSDIKDKANLIEKAKTIVSSAPSNEKTLMDLLKAKASDLAQKLAPIYGDQKESVWSTVIAQARDIEQTSPSDAAKIQQSLKDIIDQAQTLVGEALNQNQELLKQVQDLMKPVEKDMSDANDLTFRVVASPIIVSNATDKLVPIEADAKLVRYFRSMLGVD